MSIDMKRSWRKESEVEHEEDMKNNARSNNSSRDSSSSSNNRKKTKPNQDQRTRQGPPSGKTREMESDPTILQRRQKQIDYGKNTVGYHNYTKKVPYDTRSKQHPKTPDKYTKYSRRSWDMMIKLWRKELHSYDTSGAEYKDDDENGSVKSDSVKSESIKDENEDYDNVEVIYDNIDESDVDNILAAL